MVHLIRNWEKIKLVNEDGNVNGNEDIWICLIRIDMWLKLYDLQVQRCDNSKACGGYKAVWIYESEFKKKKSYELWHIAQSCEHKFILYYHRRIPMMRQASA